MKQICFILALALAGCGGAASPIVVDSPKPTVPVTPGPVPIPEPTPAPTPKPAPVGPVFKGDQSFMPYIATFVIEALSQGHRVSVSKLSIQFGDLSARGPYVIGTCELGCVGCPKVTIKESWFKAANATNKQMLIDHELGHCLLKRPHLADVFTDGTPVSVMYPSMFSAKVFLGHADEYIAELFNAELTSIYSDSPASSIFVCE